MPCPSGGTVPKDELKLTETAWPKLSAGKAVQRSSRVRNRMADWASGCWETLVSHRGAFFLLADMGPPLLPGNWLAKCSPRNVNRTDGQPPWVQKRGSSGARKRATAKI